jgi:hypothetical protein
VRVSGRLALQPPSLAGEHSIARKLLVFFVKPVFIATELFDIEYAMP